MIKITLVLQAVLRKFMALPSKNDIEKFIHESAGPVLRRDIARAFNIKGNDRIYLKQTLKELEEGGHIERDRSKSYKPPESLPGVTIVEVIEISGDGEIIAKPVKWHGSGDAPIIYMSPNKKGQRQPELKDRILARLERLSKTEYNGKSIKHFGDSTANKIVGVFTPHKGGGFLTPTDKKDRDDYFIADGDASDAQEDDLVLAEIQPTAHRGGRQKSTKNARILKILGNKNDPKNISLISIHTFGITDIFPQDVITESEATEVPELGKREDLRQIPLVTIDGADARDFDDAVFAEADTDPDNPGGFHLIVAIADVSYYVRPGSPLDKEAYQRGNSTYFPDRVVPMLPEKLCNDICSLRPHEPRACLAAHMWIDKSGGLIRYKFVRGLMQSHARLIYEQVQAAYDGLTDATTKPLLDGVLKPLYAAYAVLESERQHRGALELDLPDRQAIISDKGDIRAIVPRMRLDSHKLIEEFMILANVAAARALEDKDSPCVYRVHDRPNSAKLDDAKNFLGELGYSFAKGTVLKPKNINAILEKAKNTDESHLVSTVVLRCQSQALYSPDNLGHFGLALRQYAHFTSPIRRYADLIVHRLLVDRYRLGPGEFKKEDLGLLPEMSEHISEAERLSMSAERSAMDRFTSLFLSGQVGNEFSGRISGVTRFGLFISLDETGADGIVPIRTLPKDYYIHDEGQHALIGRHHGLVFRLCAPITVKLIEADPIKGSTVFALVDENGADIPGFKPQPRRRSKGASKKTRHGKPPKNGHSQKRSRKKPTRKQRKNKKKID